MKQNINIEAEGNELILKNKAGDYVIIPKKYRLEVQDMIKENCHSCIDKLVETLPVMEDYAQDGTVFGIPPNTSTAPSSTIQSANQNVNSNLIGITREDIPQYNPGQTFIGPDNRTDQERKIAREYTESVLNPSIRTQIGETFQKPLRWLADPVKVVGDIVSSFAPNSPLAKDLPNTNAETFEYRKKQLNPYISNKEKRNNTFNEAIPLTNWALLNILPVEAATGNMIKSGKNLIKPVSKVVGKTDDATKVGSKVLNKRDELIPLYRIQEKNAKTFAELTKEGKIHPSFNTTEVLKRKANEEKYFGEWFTKDKNDLDWYKKDREFKNPEIIQLNVPKTRLKEFQNYDKTLSRAPDREFVVPKNLQKEFLNKTDDVVRLVERKQVFDKETLDVIDRYNKYFGKNDPNSTLTMADKIKIGRDVVSRKNLEKAYRNTHIEEILDARKKGYFNNEKFPDTDWYYGGSSSRYGNIEIEAIPDSKFFRLFEVDGKYAGTKTQYKDVLHLKGNNVPYKGTIIRYKGKELSDDMLERISKIYKKGDNLDEIISSITK